MTSAPTQWPLPGQVDPTISPCVFCRRRITIGGKPLFKSCSCKAFGPPVTIAALALGALLVLGGAWWASRQRTHLD
ncbi:MAG: hypothetical protein ACRYFZ_07490 [Janthinobacterium lividum]